MEKLVAAYNPAAAAGVMCRTTLSVGWDGRLYDCDFNQMLDLGLAPGLPRHIRDFDLDAAGRPPDRDRPALLRLHGGQRLGLPGGHRRRLTGGVPAEKGKLGRCPVSRCCFIKLRNRRHGAAHGRPCS